MSVENTLVHFLFYELVSFRKGTSVRRGTGELRSVIIVVSRPRNVLTVSACASRNTITEFAHFPFCSIFLQPRLHFVKGKVSNEVFLQHLVPYLLDVLWDWLYTTQVNTAFRAP